MVPRIRSKHAEAKAKIWNILHKDVRQASTLTMFKSRLKTVLFTRAYDTESILSALLLFIVIHFYVDVLWIDFICFNLI